MRKIASLALLLAAIPVATGIAAKPAAATLTIATAPNPATFGHYVTVTGAISTKAAGETITLEALPAPYTGKYAKVGTATTAAPDGAYSITVTPQLNTKYKVTAPHATDSAEVTQLVRWHVGLKVSDRTPKRGKRVRFHGTVKPANPNAPVLIQKKTSTGWRTVKQTTLATGTATSSGYSVKLRIKHSGRYRAEVAGNGALETGNSRSRRLKVH